MVAPINRRDIMRGRDESDEEANMQLDIPIREMHETMEQQNAEPTGEGSEPVSSAVQTRVSIRRGQSMARRCRQARREGVVYIGRQTVRHGRPSRRGFIMYRHRMVAIRQPRAAMMCDRIPSTGRINPNFIARDSGHCDRCGGLYQRNLRTHFIRTHFILPRYGKNEE